ncbi:TRAP transporter large permease [Microbacterium sp. NPDC077644]|uniref:TRAP transporter large permease n=1 Tax=Microbacterium sp. NPDC077644 TaxID=3155055 RepID=UPI00344C6BCF
MPVEVLIIAAVAVIILIAFIVSEQPIWIGLAAAGSIGLLMLEGSGITVATIGSKPFSAVSSYSLVIIPMFVLMGVIATRAGLAEDIFAVARKFSRRLPGSLGIATVLASGGFGAVSGSSAATVVTVGRMAVGEMTNSGYRPNSAAALVAIGGTLGVLIPPSIALIVFASLTGESVGALLLAAVIPGILTILVYSIMVVIMYRRGSLTEPGVVASRAGAAAKGGAKKSSRVQGAELTQTFVIASERSSITRRNIVGALYAGGLFLIIVGGLYTGLVTATESGAMAAAIALVILGIRLWRTGPKKLAVNLKDSFAEATSLSAMIFALLLGGSIFSYFIVSTRIPAELARFIIDADLPVYGVLIAAIILLVILGAFLESLSLMLITVPLLYPIAAGIGVDGIWFGILVVKAVEIGLVTPPFGLNVFVAAGISKKTTAEGIFRAVLPMILAEFVVIALLLAVPELVTWLPGLVRG